MPRRYSIALALLALTVIGSALPAHAQSKDDPYSIMVPEPGTPAAKPKPWLAPKYQSPRGTRQHISVPRPTPPKAVQPKAPTAPKVPPPIIAPDTGRALPNLPTLSPSGPHGTETFQDRAARCAEQAGIYGQAVGNRNAYIGRCINQ